MRTRSLLPHDCAWASKHVSARLDSDLSEFEEVLLAAQLERCPDCRAYAESLEAVTEILRTAPMEEPSLSYQLPRRSRFSAPSMPRLRLAPRSQARVFALPAISAAAVVVALGGLVSLHALATPAPGVDLRAVRELRGLKERALEQLEVVAQPVEVRPGLTAVEQVTLGAVSATRPQPAGDAKTGNAKRLSFRSDRYSPPR